MSTTDSYRPRRLRPLHLGVGFHADNPRWPVFLPILCLSCALPRRVLQRTTHSPIIPSTRETLSPCLATRYYVCVCIYLYIHTLYTVCKYCVVCARQRVSLCVRSIASLLAAARDVCFLQGSLGHLHPQRDTTRLRRRRRRPRRRLRSRPARAYACIGAYIYTYCACILYSGLPSGQLFTQGRGT